MLVQTDHMLYLTDWSLRGDRRFIKIVKINRNKQKEQTKQK